MKKLIVSVLLLTLGAMTGSVAMAKGGGGGGGVGGGAGGHSAANSNGVHSVDRDKGLDRAGDRRNSHSTAKRHTKKRMRPIL